MKVTAKGKRREFPPALFVSVLNFWWECYACELGHFSHVWLFATLWTVACQAPLSIGFSKQEYWCGFPYPTGVSSQPKDQTCISYVSCIGRQVLYHWATWGAIQVDRNVRIQQRWRRLSLQAQRVIGHERRGCSRLFRTALFLSEIMKPC